MATIQKVLSRRLNSIVGAGLDTRHGRFDANTTRQSSYTVTEQGIGARCAAAWLPVGRTNTRRR
eukprot:3053287-Amphidinium_carterae.1